MTTNQLYKKLIIAISDEGIQVPDKGFKTAKQWAKEFKCSFHFVGKMARRLIKQGKCERRMYKIRQGKTNVAPTPHYKFNL